MRDGGDGGDDRGTGGSVSGGGISDGGGDGGAIIPFTATDAVVRLLVGRGWDVR